MPATLDKLPDELLKLIIDYVEAADERWRELQIDPRRPVASSGCWGPMYGRGVFALGHVNKRWNALARPILFKSLNCKQIGSPFFLLHVLAEPLGHHVQHLRLELDSQESLPHLALAAALKKLPNVTSIKVVGPVLHETDYAAVDV
ncbi:hypothetical protein JCM8208_007737 [Rhodotorula glutinis]